MATGGGWITGRSYTPEVTDGTTTTQMTECRYNSHANGGEKFTAKQRERLHIVLTFALGWGGIRWFERREVD
ncbi:MAG: hypothetical protein K6T83_18475 [Alicyclobacillus sp.]|nr:hypothetical protein [Alicyclobacillus sp.]